MKKNIHPEYKFVVFEDTSNGEKFLGKSTKYSKETTTFEGQEYPVIKVATSSTSHPFYTGKSKFVDEELINLRKNITYNINKNRVAIFNSSNLCFF